jgi:biofilm PGA synthesis protein PgaD
MIRSPLIIDVAAGRPAWLRYRDWLLSVAMWLGFLYLIRAVFIDAYVLIDEAFGWAFLDAPQPNLPTVSRFLYTAGLYAIVVIVNGVILIGWASYNQYRFRGPDTRKGVSAVGVAELGRFYGFSGDEVAEWQRARGLMIIHNTDGKLVAVIPKPIDGTERAESSPAANIDQPQPAQV